MLAGGATLIHREEDVSCNPLRVFTHKGSNKTNFGPVDYNFQINLSILVFLEISHCKLIYKFSFSWFPVGWWLVRLLNKWRTGFDYYTGKNMLRQVQSFVLCLNVTKSLEMFLYQ